MGNGIWPSRDKLGVPFGGMGSVSGCSQQEYFARLRDELKRRLLHHVQPRPPITNRNPGDWRSFCIGRQCYRIRPDVKNAELVRDAWEAFTKLDGALRLIANLADAKLPCDHEWLFRLADYAFEAGRFWDRLGVRPAEEIVAKSKTATANRRKKAAEINRDKVVPSIAAIQQYCELRAAEKPKTAAYRRAAKDNGVSEKTVQRWMKRLRDAMK